MRDRVSIADPNPDPRSYFDVNSDLINLCPHSVVEPVQSGPPPVQATGSGFFFFTQFKQKLSFEN